MRTYGLVRALLHDGPVDLVWVPFGGDSVPHEYSDLDGLTTHRVSRSRPLARAFAYGLARLRGVPSPVARGVSPRLAQVTDGLVDEPCRVVADDPAAAISLWALAARRPVIYSAHNLESAFREDWGRPSTVRRFEARLLDHVAETWMPSRADVEGAAALAPSASIHYVPNVVDVAAITPARGTGRRALFVADFTYRPNREGLCWLIEEVAPLLADDIELVVVGRGLDPKTVSRRVRVLGFVDDLDGLYATVGCALVPLLTGGGSPLKFVEALAHAVPVVATPRAARGLEAAPGEHFFEGASAAEFATAIQRALDPVMGRRVGDAGRLLAEAEYSVESLTTRVS